MNRLGSLSCVVIFTACLSGPARGEPETCRAPVLVPERFETITEQVLDTPERTEIRVHPAVYETVSEKHLVRDARIEHRILPAETIAVTEQVMVRPERVVTVIVPAVLETYTEEVLVANAHKTWRMVDDARGLSASLGGKSSEADRSLMELVEVPARYETVTRSRIITPERSESQLVPAEYQTIVKQVEVTPERIEKVELPPEYETVLVERMVTPAWEELVVVPATYRTVESRIITKDATIDWRDVICDTALSRETILSLQRSLRDRGHEVSEDGTLGEATRRAMEAFQRAEGLGVGELTVETLDALGIPIVK